MDFTDYTISEQSQPIIFGISTEPREPVVPKQTKSRVKVGSLPDVHPAIYHIALAIGAGLIIHALFRFL